jgi:hypothetical protein
MKDRSSMVLKLTQEALDIIQRMKLLKLETDRRLSEIRELRQRVVIAPRIGL